MAEKEFRGEVSTAARPIEEREQPHEVPEPAAK